MSTQVLTELINTAGSKKIAVATLNRPETLNGLSLPMCHALTSALTEWEQDPSVALVVLRGAGDRAFCAGGDIKAIYESILENTSNNAWNNSYTREFFEIEYRLDYQIHTYSKPILCWGSGIVMGGGVGLMMGASHRVVTETTRFAMPEITIGLFPDVGGTWMLSRLPNGIGNFLALTAAQLGAFDCEWLGLADYTVASNSFDVIVNQLKELNWQDDRIGNDTILQQVLEANRLNVEAGPLHTNYSLIRQACSGSDLDQIASNINSLEQHTDPWLARAAKTFAAGSPGSARLSFALLQRAKFMSLADVFRQEYIVALQCGVIGDVQEGIRALIIDKDKSPKWNPASLDQATNDWVQQFFTAPWPETTRHPLANLGVSN